MTSWPGLKELKWDPTPTPRVIVPLTEIFEDDWLRINITVYYSDLLDFLCTQYTVETKFCKGLES